MNQDHTQADLILQSIHLVQKLRHDVGHVFKDLADGISEYAEETPEKEETDGTASSKSDSKETKSAQTQKETSGAGGEKSDEQQDKHRAILRTLKKSLETISHDFSDLEKLGSNLMPVQTIQTSSNIDSLSLDPVDKNTVMHSQLLQSYKWTNKMHELANQAVSILSQNTLKRTQSPKFINSKKQKVSMLNACLASTGFVDSFVASLDQSHPDMAISISRPLGSCGIMQIELGRTLRAIVVLRGLMIEWVKVKGIDETFKTDDGQIDIWSTSRYQVFQKITDHAEAASLHFYAPAIPEIAIKSFVLWLQGFSNLFSAPCHKCGKYLQNSMPSTWRDYRSREPFHDVCRM